MTKERLERLEKKGFSVEVMSQMLGRIHLINCISETILNEYDEYLKPFGLANEFRNELYAVRKTQKNATARLNMVIPKAGMLHLMQDHEKGNYLLEQYAEKYIKEFLSVKTRYRAENGKVYYYRQDGGIKKAYDKDRPEDKKRHQELNYYQSPKEAII